MSRSAARGAPISPSSRAPTSSAMTCDLFTSPRAPHRFDLLHDAPRPQVMSATGDGGGEDGVSEQADGDGIIAPRRLLQKYSDDERDLHECIELAQRARAHVYRSIHRGVDDIAPDD